MSSDTTPTPKSGPFRVARPRMGLRREARLFLPIAAMVLLALSAFTLLSYRRAIEQSTSERHREALAVAESLASRWSGSAVSESDLRAVLGIARGAALIDDAGFARREVGLLPEGSLLTPVAGERPNQPMVVGPNRVTGPVVVAYAPVSLADRRALLRVDLPATALAGQQRAIRRLTWLVIGVGIAVLALLFQYLGHLLSPIDALLARAKAVPATAGEEEAKGEDEVAFLLRSFDRALDSIARTEHDRDEAGDMAQLEKSLGSVESGMLLLDRDGELLALNEVGALVLGIEEPSVPTPVGPCLTLHPALLEILTRCLTTGEGVQRAECMLEREGQPLPLGLSVHPLRRDDGSVRGWLCLFADLTEVRKSDRERQLSESLERVGELTAGLAHELRNSLASLRGYLTLIERGGEREDLADYVAEVRQEADHLYRVLQDFLSFAQPGSARMERVDLERVAHRAASDPGLGGAAVRVVRTAGETPLPTVQGDPQLLERVLRNLIHNAIRAQAEVQARAGARAPATESNAIEVLLEAEQDMVTARVLDRGSGIPKELEGRLFVPFASGSADGTGLGLALARRIAELHHGNLTLTNRKDGGAEAVLSLPIGRSATKSSGR